MKRYQKPNHLAWLRTLPCLICGDVVTTEAAHIRMADARIGKLNPGGVRPHDFFCVPLCGQHHREQHKQSEYGFWKSKDIDPVLIALALYAVSGDINEADRILNANVKNILAAG